MKRFVHSAVVGCFLFLLAGCAAITPPPSTAVLPPFAFGANMDNTTMAINVAQWAFASPARTRGSLINGTRAVLAVEYLAGALSTDPTYQYMSGITKQQMLEARVAVRKLIGVAPEAPSQEVANALLALTLHPAEAAQIIKPPLFALSPAETVSRLENLPFIPIANRASQGAGAQEFPGGNCVVCG